MSQEQKNIDDSKNEKHVQQQIIKCQVTMQDKSVLKFSLKKQTIKVKQLKQQIYNQNDLLEPQQMRLMFKNQQLEDENLINLFLQENQLKIEQQKQCLTKIKGVTVAKEADPYGIDDVVVRMPCGHVIGTEGMMYYLGSLVNQKSIQLKCKFKTSSSSFCNRQWQFGLCSTVGVMTSKQRIRFEEQFSTLALLKKTSECPNCHIRLLKQTLQHNRVRCPNCDSGDYCYLCNQEWKQFGNLVCGNSNCWNQQKAIRQSPLQKQFILTDKKQNPPKDLKIMAPLLRACPKCLSVINHEIGCKHVRCGKCNTQFCWICLEMQGNDHKYACGYAGDWCGKVAPNQDVDF